MVGAQPGVFKVRTELGTWASTDFNPLFIVLVCFLLLSQNT